MPTTQGLQAFQQGNEVGLLQGGVPASPQFLGASLQITHRHRCVILWWVFRNGGDRCHIVRSPQHTIIPSGDGHLHDTHTGGDRRGGLTCCLQFLPDRELVGWHFFTCHTMRTVNLILRVAQSGRWGHGETGDDLPGDADIHVCLQKLSIVPNKCRSITSR